MTFPLLSSLALLFQLAQPIDGALSNPALAHAVIGIDVEDDSGRVLYARNADVLLIPASNRKLFAAATAVNCLGFDHQFATELWIDGRDLVIKGGGDPSLGGRYAFDRDAVFAPFVAALRARGVAAIDGDLIADVSSFDRTTLPPSWKWGNLGADYAAPVDALAYNENVAGVVVDNSVVTTDPFFLVAELSRLGTAAIHADATNTIHVDGATPSRVEALIAVSDPALYAAQALRNALHHAGIDVRGAVRVNTTAHAWSERIAVIESPPLAALLATMLKASQNLYAEMLLKDAGSGAYADGLELEKRFAIDELGVDARSLRFVDGSGLSPDDLVTPSAIVKLLRWMNHPSRRGMWWALLVTPGEQEGTLRRRLADLAPRLRAKTGTINSVNALSGIIAGTHGGYRYFSIMIDHHVAESGDVTKVIDEVVRTIANW
jgi:D-alanyl-D-alanine carboxypeptidase/D-alanyl-D-alanine-endopeptidase (penicillin-binding protein 4)